MIYAGIHVIVAAIFLCSVVCTVVSYLFRQTKIGTEPQPKVFHNEVDGLDEPIDLKKSPVESSENV